VPAPAKKATPARKLGAPAKPVAPPKPVKPTRGPYANDQKFLDEQRDLLLEERVTYQQQADDLRAEAESLALDREPGDVQFDEESGEGGTVAVDRERDLTLSAQALATIDEINFALTTIETKMYGACENCGQPIPKARLRALPYARLCVACKSGGLHRR
jgi:DnaK suppressor protein